MAFEISDSKNITIANYRAYRVTRSYNPFPAAIRVYGSSGIRFRNVPVNAEHGYGDLRRQRLRHEAARRASSRSTTRSRT